MNNLCRFGWFKLIIFALSWSVSWINLVFPRFSFQRNFNFQIFICFSCPYWGVFCKLLIGISLIYGFGFLLLCYFRFIFCTTRFLLVFNLILWFFQTGGRCSRLYAIHLQFFRDQLKPQQKSLCRARIKLWSLWIEEQSWELCST